VLVGLLDAKTRCGVSLKGGIFFWGFVFRFLVVRTKEGRDGGREERKEGRKRGRKEQGKAATTRCKSISRLGIFVFFVRLKCICTGVFTNANWTMIAALIFSFSCLLHACYAKACYGLVCSGGWPNLRMRSKRV